MGQKIKKLKKIRLHREGTDQLVGGAILEQVTLHKTDQVQKLLEYYMGKNTMERQNFIIENLVVEEDLPEDDNI